ncbi:replication region DNA-binding N-term [Pseudomonas sp. NFPP33]|jgi:chromosome segregation ATPase|nr:DNA-binding protein [Pseudomonas sp. NFPP33]AGH89266.1 KfrA: regulator protein [uncultured bacterium]SDA85265.1 replication region DNA-binding N-term [Pseudomonas sp. NFPP33]
MEHQDNTAATTAAIPADVRARVIEAANQLFEESGGVRFPVIADVRRLAKTDMNATSAVMREWKRQQTAKPEPVAVSVPEAVQQAAQESAATTWLAAQDLANASLRSAQASWAVERDEMESMRQELAQLYEAQARELEEAQQALGVAIRAKEEAERNAAELAERLNTQQSRADQAEARAKEIEHRAADLKEELARAHEETKAVRQELTEARILHLAETEQLKTVAAQQIEQARSELATFKGKAEAIQESQSQQIEQLQADLLQCKAQLATVTAEGKAAAQDAAREAKRSEGLQAERDQAQQEAAAARENAAHLTGQLEAVQSQSAALLERLNPKKANKP